MSTGRERQAEFLQGPPFLDHLLTPCEAERSKAPYSEHFSRGYLSVWPEK